MAKVICHIWTLASCLLFFTLYCCLLYAEKVEIDFDHGFQLNYPEDTPEGDIELAGENDTTDASSEIGEIADPAEIFNNYTNVFKGGTHYLRVCYVIDQDYIDKSSLNQSSILETMKTQVEFADWFFRPIDYDSDAWPENIGLRLHEVKFQHISNSLKSRQNSSNPLGAGDFLELLEFLGLEMDDKCQARFIIAPQNEYKILADLKGCTGCIEPGNGSLLTGIIDSEELLSKNNVFRHLQHLVRILSHHDKERTDKCQNEFPLSSETSSKSPQSLKYMECLLKKEGTSCLKEFSTRPSCLTFEASSDFCGNGILEKEEECDCGSLVSCRKEFNCGPRNGVKPCKKIKLKRDQKISKIMSNLQFAGHLSIFNASDTIDKIIKNLAKF